MNYSTVLDSQIGRFGFWSAIVAIATTVVSALLPLDAPAGYSAEHAERVAWLSANRGAFIAGWLNQIAAMLSLSGVFFAIAWQIAAKNPLRAILAAMVILMSVMAFIIVKFMAVWTIPLLADSITAGAVGADMADTLLQILNVSIPFSLYTSFDWLGFWLYAVFALLVAGPLWIESKVEGGAAALKVAAATLAIFGIVYHAMLAALLMGA
ncbi:MAG: hypothetical protein AB8B48_07135, partial [Pseudomonadales bacterium]